MNNKLTYKPKILWKKLILLSLLFITIIGKSQSQFIDGYNLDDSTQWKAWRTNTFVDRLIYEISGATYFRIGADTLYVNQCDSIHRVNINPNNLLFSYGNGAIRTTNKSLIRFTFNNITNLQDSLNVRYTKNQSDLKFKSISYSPSATEINTGLGYTAYNGATNPLGFMSASSLVHILLLQLMDYYYHY